MVYPKKLTIAIHWKYSFQMSTWTFIKCSSVSFVVDLSIRVPKRSHLRRSLMKLHVFLAKLFPFLAIRVFSLLYILSPQSLSCWRCHTYYLHFSKTIFLLVPRNSFMFSLPSLYDWGFFFGWCCFSLPSVINLKLPTEKGGWCTIYILVLKKHSVLKVKMLVIHVFFYYLASGKTQ